MLADVKTLVTIGDADLRLLSLVDLTVVQGEPTEFEVRIPAGYELAGVTGSSLDRSEQQGERLLLVVSAPAQTTAPVPDQSRACRAQAARSRSRPPSRPCPPRSAKPAKSPIEGIGTLEISPPTIRRTPPDGRA